MIVLMYHDIVTSADKGSGFQNESAFLYKVDELQFEKQVKKTQGDEVLFSFDDGGESFYTKAAPILEKYGMRGIFFISTKYIGTKGFLTERQIRELDGRGHIIGSHSHTHPVNMAALSREEVAYEWKESISILSRILGKKVEVASVPNGYNSKVVIEEAIMANINVLYTSMPTDKEVVKNGLKLIGRYVVHNNMSNNYVVNGVVANKNLRMKLYRRWQAINILKLLLGNSYNTVKTFLLGKS